ncbi:hypothetical protein [Streptomyces sp. CB02959]|uniref:hypothetical protein n=1 Tax=Streptomyces sp. CB02959 TaxID=2020330 RepID=UPI00215358CD|nr:hypothetical protein [Streptomyces sp. CB02959]
MAKKIEQAAQGEAVVVGVACRPGTEPPRADGRHVQRHGDRVCAAVVDGAGHHEAVVAYAAIAPAVITHTGMVMGGLAGLTAGRADGARLRRPAARQRRLRLHGAGLADERALDRGPPRLQLERGRAHPVDH